MFCATATARKEIITSLSTLSIHSRENLLLFKSHLHSTRYRFSGGHIQALYQGLVEVKQKLSALWLFYGNGVRAGAATGHRFPLADGHRSAGWSVGQRASRSFRLDRSVPDTPFSPCVDRLLTTCWPMSNPPLITSRPGGRGHLTGHQGDKVTFYRGHLGISIILLLSVVTTSACLFRWDKFLFWAGTFYVITLIKGGTRYDNKSIRKKSIKVDSLH